MEVIDVINPETTHGLEKTKFEDVLRQTHGLCPLLGKNDKG